MSQDWVCMKPLPALHLYVHVGVCACVYKCVSVCVLVLFR